METLDTIENNKDTLLKREILKNRVELNETLIEERYEDMQQIYKDVDCINEIFKDLHKLVIEQEEPIENIITNIENTKETTEKSIELLQQAEIYHRKNISLKNKFLFFSLIGLTINAPITLFLGVKIGLISSVTTIGATALTSLITKK